MDGEGNMNDYFVWHDLVVREMKLNLGVRIGYRMQSRIMFHFFSYGISSGIIDAWNAAIILGKPTPKLNHQTQNQGCGEANVY
jgi:hypothetical protein